MKLPTLHRVKGDFSLIDSDTKELFPVSHATIDELCARSNSHDELVSSLARIVGLIDSEYLVAASDGSGRIGHAVAQARAAIAKAKGQP